MKTIVLKAQEGFFLKDNTLFIVKKGAVVTRNILENGRVISNDNCLRKEELVFNCFNFLEKKEEKTLPKIEVEIEALEDSIIVEVDFPKEEMVINEIYQKMLWQLIKKAMINLFSQVYSGKGYILMMLKLYANSEGIITKKGVQLDNFNIGKTQFYKIYKILKEESYIIEKGKKLHLNLPKLEEYLLKELIEV